MNHLLIKMAQMIDPGGIPNVPKTELTSGRVNDMLQIVFGIFAAVAVLIISIAAFMIVVSRGKSEDVSRARDAIIYASIGLIISLMALTIVTFVVGNI